MPLDSLKWSTALPDWEERLFSQSSLVPPGLPLFPAEAQDAMDVFLDLKLVDVIGHPTIGSICRPWILDFARAFFGSLNAEQLRREIRNFFLLVAKKNTKSTIAAGLMLTELIRNTRDSAEFLIIAPTLEIANNSFFPARDMIRHDDDLRRMMHIQEHTRTITDRNTDSTLKVVSAENDTVSGKKAVGVLIDELWLFGNRAGADAMIMEATGGLMSRDEGFVMALSTQSEKAPAGVFLEWLERYRAIRDGVWPDGRPMVDKRSLGVLYELPERMMLDKSWQKPENFKFVNPNLGASINDGFLNEKYKEAYDGGESKFRIFCAKHLNVQINIALRSDSWAGAEYWLRGIDETITLESILARCECVCVGIDGGGLDDLLGVCVIGREKITKKWLCWFRAFISPEGMERRKNNEEVYRNFIDEGSLIFVENLPDDLQRVIDIVKTVKLSGLLGKNGVGCDKMGLGQIVDALALIGVSEEQGNYTNVRQGIGLMGSFKTFERKLVDGTLKHDGSKMMKWQASNAKMSITPTATRISREDSGQGKIDSLMAGFNAAAIMNTNPKPTGNFQFFTIGGNRQ